MPTSHLTVTLDRKPTAEAAITVGEWVMAWICDEDVASQHAITTKDKSLLIETQYPVTQQAVTEFLTEVNCYVTGDLSKGQLCVQDVTLLP
jgi:hypothetical protein